MPVITISITFIQGGTGAINIIPSQHPQWEPNQSEHRNFELPMGNYDIPYAITTMGGGSIIVVYNGKIKDAEELIEGVNTGILHVTVD